MPRVDRKAVAKKDLMQSGITEVAKRPQKGLPALWGLKGATQ